VWQVLPNLKVVGWHLQQSVKFRRMKCLKLLARCFGALKSKQLLRRISETFLGKTNTKRILMVFEAVRQNAIERVSRRDAVLEQILI